MRGKPPTHWWVVVIGWGVLACAIVFVLLNAWRFCQPKGSDFPPYQRVTWTIVSGAVVAIAWLIWQYVLFVMPLARVSPQTVPVTNALADPALYAGMIDAFSMRNWQLSGQSGHDHFFATFGKFGQATDGATDKMLAETASRAASQHEVYQELMLTPTGKDLETLAKSLGWNDDFGVMQQKLLAERTPSRCWPLRASRSRPRKHRATTFSNAVHRKPIPVARSSSASCSRSRAANPKRSSSRRSFPAS